MQNRIRFGEYSCTGQIHLTRPTLFRRGANNLHGALAVVIFQPTRQRHASTGGRSTEHMMATGVASTPFLHHRAFWHCCLA